MEKQGAASKVRTAFIQEQTPLTLFDIALKTNLKSPSNLNGSLLFAKTEIFKQDFGK